MDGEGEPMSLINREDLMQTLGITDMDCEKCGWYSRTARRCKRGSDFEDACCAIDDAPTIEPERKKDTIQKFHDYQVEWLLAHCDLELEPQLEEWVVRFLHDTANCYMMEIEGAEPEDIPMEYFESGGR